MNRRDYTFISAGIIAALVIAMFVSVFASSFPDGLEKVAENLGFINKAEGIVPESIFLIPDYVFGAVENELWQTSLAGLSGVLIILAVFGVVYLIYKAGGKKE
ncbi:MAG: PDGLE domain-containing protein [Actinobacteria bacterium]|nr:PDGLE domain-containing protein [Actinomycetota bacterium]